MQSLDKSLRNQLETTVVEARELAETAANAALEELGVGESAPYPHLSERQRDLRRRLRLHGRQLGDRLNGGKVQSMDRLVEEIAYEHWHRMLFACFLAENDLLMYPDPDGPVPVTLQDCEDLAVDEGAANGWELAARYATQMLPQIFRVDSPVFELKLPTNFQRPLERLLANLPPDVFTASDALGWVYQFWQTNNKERINRSEAKIGARELPAVTQLFTEPYMVSFLLDNALGAWWAARRLSEDDLHNSVSEEELRRKAAISGVPLDYLRFVREADEDGVERWTPAAGTFPDWPEQLSELKTLDPCCGSGHFLVSLLLMLTPLRMEMEGLDARQAVDAVLRDNLHGLELDQRCVELAAFALALTAWRYPGAGGYRKLPEIQVACSGLSVSVAKEEWKQLGLGKQNLSIALDWLHDAFRDAPVLGSLLNPAKTEAAKVVPWDELSGVLDQALRQESTDEQHEVAVVAQGLAKAATLLAGQYTWVVTNVPYKTANELVRRLKTFMSRNYSAGDKALETAFILRCMEFLEPGGVASVVTTQNALFLTTYKSWREKLLREETWNLVARLGEKAFESSQAAGAFAAMLTLTRGNAISESGTLFNRDTATQHIRGVDVSEFKTAADKAAALLGAVVKSVEQTRQLENPDAIIQADGTTAAPRFSEHAACYQGTSTGDNPRFIRSHFEVCFPAKGLQYLESVSDFTSQYAGKSNVIDWEGVTDFEGAALRGHEAFNRRGIGIGQMRSLPATLYLGSKFPNTTPVVVPHSEGGLAAAWCFCSSQQFFSDLRALNQKLSVDNGYVGKIPFDVDHWTSVAAEQYPHGLPEAYSNDPTQWIFHGHPSGSVIWDEESKWTAHGPLRSDDTVLQVAVARLLGYRWPAELDPDMELAAEQREWVERCEALLPYADDDGIVCIPPVRGEAAAADRLLGLLAAAYGDEYSNHLLAKLLASVDHAGKTLEGWLREKFFFQHCRLFQQRPFIWHIWDGLRDGFAALVNYHNLDHKTLEMLIYTYLGDWISRQKQDIKNGVDGAQEKLAAAEVLKERLELILEGEQPYDIFVRWKPLDEQPIGWNPDLNDGVRLNIRPFMTLPDIKKKGAGVLRDKPNIKWTKDRGKDVESAPWFHVFGGERINHYHLSLAEKRAAHEQTGDAS